jgi:hypothetical protein
MAERLLGGRRPEEMWLNPWSRRYKTGDHSRCYADDTFALVFDFTALGCVSFRWKESHSCSNSSQVGDVDAMFSIAPLLRDDKENARIVASMVWRAV